MTFPPGSTDATRGVLIILPQDSDAPPPGAAAECTRPKWALSALSPCAPSRDGAACPWGSHGSRCVHAGAPTPVKAAACDVGGLARQSAEPEAGARLWALVTSRPGRGHRPELNSWDSPDSSLVPFRSAGKSCGRTGAVGSSPRSPRDRYPAFRARVPPTVWRPSFGPLVWGVWVLHFGNTSDVLSSMFLRN